MGCLESKESKTEEEKPVYSWDRPGRPDPADFTIADEDGSVKFRLPGSIDGQQFMIRNCKNSQVYLFDHSATITVDDCENCKFVFGPIKGSIFFRNCKDCQSIVACQQFRTRDCKKLDTFLCCTSQPIIESSTGMKFGCYQYSYPELSGQFKKATLSPFNNNWSNIHDFTPVPGENNWSLVPEDASLQSYVPLPAIPELSSVKISTSTEDSVVPLTRSGRESHYNESCLLAFFGKSTDQCMDFLKKLKQRGTCDIVQTKEISMSVADAKRIFQNEDYAVAVENGPVIGVEINGTECVNLSKQTMAAMELKQSELHISETKESAQSEIDAFYNFVDISMN